MPSAASGSKNDEFEESLRSAAIAVLKLNDLGHSTKPSPALYPHQWLWDSCFIAIGLRHLEVERAEREILTLLHGQWSNGMLPHEIFAHDSAYYAGPKTWRSYLIKGS